MHAQSLEYCDWSGVPGDQQCAKLQLQQRKLLGLVGANLFALQMHHGERKDFGGLRT